MKSVRIIHSINEIMGFQEGWFVPTMGALHEGHGALIRHAVAMRGGASDRPIVVSIFVNPTQFAPGEDFSRYPRTLEADVELSERCGADVIFTPSGEVMYPSEQDIPIPTLPPTARTPRLEDAFRPHHFAGVCQVVARLFDLVRPRVAIFGEKDYQQLRVLSQLVEQERPRWGDLEVIGHPTVREPDGLALSSRNRYLRAEQREQALGLYRALCDAAEARDPGEAERVMHDTLNSHGLEIDYAVVRDAETLTATSTHNRPRRALIAARLDTVRLIDNGSVG